MKREILFRGQTRRKGEKVWMDGTPVASNWVYGGVIQGQGDFSIIYETDPEIKKRPVYTDTLGQYTGLTDKNGRKIFEGDVLKVENPKPFSPYIAAVKYEEARFVWGVYNLGEFENPEQLEIIGNIHDNPELLKGE